MLHRFWVTGSHSSKEDERFWTCVGSNLWAGSGGEGVKSPVMVWVNALGESLPPSDRGHVSEKLP